MFSVRSTACNAKFGSAPCVSLHDHLSPSTADGVDEEVETFVSYLKTSNLRKLELTHCQLELTGYYSLSPVHIATILSGLNGNNSLEELVVSQDSEIATMYNVSHACS